MSHEDKTVLRSLKFKITTKGIRVCSGDKSSENNAKVKVISSNGQKDRVTGGGNKSSEVAESGKRKLEVSLDGQKGKKRKMDRSLNFQCGNILKELMSDPAGWVFNKPVDPVELNLPDYFSIIAEPMDLGTIKRKLDDSMYFAADEFAADVRLTFSNAMLYNPPKDNVHKWAKRLNGNFSKRWKSMEEKLKRRNNVVEEDCMERNGQYTKQTVENIGPNNAPLGIKLGTCRPMPFQEKRVFRLELVQLLSKKMTITLRIVLQKFGLIGLNKEKLDSFIDSTDDETLRKLRKEIKGLLDARDGNVEPSQIAQNMRPPFRKTAQKEHSNQSAPASAIRGQPIGLTETNCSSCLSLKCHCRLKTGSTQASRSDISSERSSEHDNCGDSKLDCKDKYVMAPRTSSFGLDSDGPGVVLNEENSSHLSTPATAVTSVEGGTSINIQLSPNKALRAAMLKSRFADTIFKATHQALVDHGEKPDFLRMQQERERLEKEQREERARIEAEVKAAEAASRMKEQNELKMLREREREAARMALQKMEKTVEIDENIYILKDLETLFCEGVEGDHPLQRLGLYIKDDFLEDDDSVLCGEEGEIL